MCHGCACILCVAWIYKSVWKAVPEYGTLPCNYYGGGLILGRKKKKRKYFKKSIAFKFCASVALNYAVIKSVFKLPINYYLLKNIFFKKNIYTCHILSDDYRGMKLRAQMLNRGPGTSFYAIKTSLMLSIQPLHRESFIQYYSCFPNELHIMLIWCDSRYTCSVFLKHQIWSHTYFLCLTYFYTSNIITNPNF